MVNKDAIADLVESVHESNKHGALNATRKDISSSYYGILPLDVIRLPEQCQPCALDPANVLRAPQP